jgi:hypothetical protein
MLDAEAVCALISAPVIALLIDFSVVVYRNCSLVKTS